MTTTPPPFGKTATRKPTTHNQGIMHAVHVTNRKRLFRVEAMFCLMLVFVVGINFTDSAAAAVKRTQTTTIASSTTTTTTSTTETRRRRRRDSDNDDDEPDVEKILDSLGWDGMIGQMCQIDVNMLLNDDKTRLDDDKLETYVGRLGVGSILNNIAVDEWGTQGQNIWTISDFRSAMVQINNVAQKFARPPVIWGLDSVHGANYLYDTVLAPQPINIAASFNTTISFEFGKYASRDTRRAGISWLFSPLLGLSWNPYWSRVYETFGEDPLLVGDMAKAMVKGIQEVDDSDDDDNVDTQIIPSKAAACGKHWIGYSYPHNGHDRSPSWIPTRHLYQYFLLPWKRVLPGSSSKKQHGNVGGDDDEVIVDTVMESYTEVDGVPNAANRRTLTQLLRREMGFKGMLVTDYHEIFNLFEFHHTATSRADALRQAMIEGTVDMSMVANEPDDFFDGMNRLEERSSGSGGGSDDRIIQRIRESARRIIQLKKDLRMFDESFRMEPEDPYNQSNNQRTNNVTADPTLSTTSISSQDLQAALDATHQSIVLAKNDDNVLPLSKGKSSDEPLKILVTGPTSSSKSFQTGGWTWQWQGVDSRLEDSWFTYGDTVFSAMKKREDQFNWKVSYSCGVDILGNECTGMGQSKDYPVEEPKGGTGFVDTVKDWVGWKDEYDSSIQNAVKAMADNNVKVVVVCLGEENYTEKPGDLPSSLHLPRVSSY
jgi:beta-glucosidase